MIISGSARASHIAFQLYLNSRTPQRFIRTSDPPLIPHSSSFHLAKMQSWESRRATVPSSFRPAEAKSGHEPLCGGEDSGTIIEARNFRPRPRYHGDNRSWRGQILDKEVGDGILYAGEMTIMRIVQKIQQREFIITCNRRLVILICLKFCGFQRKKSGMGINIERKVILFFSYYFM